MIEGVKGKIYKIIVRPNVMYGMEIVALTKRLDVELESAELLRVTRRNRIRKEYIRGTAQVEQFAHSVREARLRQFRYLPKNENRYTG